MGLAMTGAILFGASAPVAKVLLSGIEPVLLASLLYLGSGIGLGAYKVIQYLIGQSVEESNIKGSEVPWLLGSVIAGGVAAPIFLMTGLQNTPAATASLLLNFECVSTTLIAAVIFKEWIGRRIWTAVICITLASIILSADPRSQWGFSFGAAGIMAACVLWGIDNNFTRNICFRDPTTIGIVKGLVAGMFSLVLALTLGNPIPRPGIVLGAMALGSISYGLSIVLFIISLRGLGAARASAWFGTAPFAGAIIAFLLFRDAPDIQFLISLPIMIAGVLFLFGEEHSHSHVHSAIEHEHCHSPGDIYHKHEHPDESLFDGSLCSPLKKPKKK